MTTFYRIDVADEDEKVIYAQASGDLGVISYISRQVVRELSGGEFTVLAMLSEIESIGGGVKRSILSITADADSVATLLKRRVANERRTNTDDSASLLPDGVGQLMDRS